MVWQRPSKPLPHRAQALVCYWKYPYVQYCLTAVTCRQAQIPAVQHVQEELVFRVAIIWQPGDVELLVVEAEEEDAAQLLLQVGVGEAPEHEPADGRPGRSALSSQGTGDLWQSPSNRRRR